MEEQLINCTPHPLNVINEDGTETYLPQSGTVLRVPTSLIECEPIGGASTFALDVGAFSILPPVRPGVYYVVSSFAAQALTGRGDSLCPGKAWKDRRTGEVIGCRGLRRVQ